MKIKNILKKVSFGVLCMGMLVNTSCNYLDIVPPEQVSLKDAMDTHDGVLGFLYSAYAYSKNDNVGDLPYGNYLSEINTTADDIINPHAWANDGSAGRMLLNTLSAQNAPGIWGHCYNGIGQCLLFVSSLDKYDPAGRGIISAAEDAEWRVEARALAAYYHFVILRRYGPIAILQDRLPLDAAQSSFPGRYHFDYCVDWICNELDECAKTLPAVRKEVEMGRMTSTICKTIKAEILLLAASPLYNGSYPYSDFKNTKWETPGYGLELISRTYDASKWQRALTATNEAIALAEGAGNRSIYKGNAYKDAGISLNELYIPGGASDEFKEAVLRMRYLHFACEQEGNHETIMHAMVGGLFTQIFASAPKEYLVKSNGQHLSGYSGHNPTLNAVKRFLTVDGLMPENDPDYLDESEWYKSAGLGNEGAGRERIINLMVNREPRFYAWIAFDGGDFGLRWSNKKGLVINNLSKDAQGFKSSTRDNSVTGFYTQKYLPPTCGYGLDGATFGWANNPSRSIFRLAELYLNRAEINAVLGNTDDAIRDVNVIRERAGAKALTKAMIGVNGMTLLDWVKNERAVEFFAEGKRYFDIRRWVEGDKYLSLGKRMGLNALAKENPTFEEFNQPISLPYEYTFAPKLYLYPIQYGDVYANPQLVQNPGF